MMKASEIVEICGGELICGKLDEQLESFKKDTREIEKGDVYVGIQGENVNGSIYFEQALKNGAKVAIVQDIEIDESIIQKYKDKVIIKVKNSVKALQEMATYKRSLYNIPVIGVTGSVGKTSTKDIIASVMSEKYNTLKTEGNYNNHIGVPLTVLGLKNHEAAVIEMGMNHFGEINVLSKIAKPTTAVITNIGTSHIGELGSRENILKAKLEILDGMESNSKIIINNDNDLLHNWYIENKNIKNIVTYGIDRKSDIMAQDIFSDENGSKFTVIVKSKPYEVKINVGGKHFVQNSLVAICVGLEYNIPMEQIIEGIKKFKLTKKRMEIVNGMNNSCIINDCYNASYDSMKAALEYLGELKKGRKIAVLGDMLELGKFEQELHEKVGESAYKNKIDILITVGKISKHIANKAIELGMEQNKVFEFERNEEAINFLKSIIQENDYILVKASNAMKFNEITEGIKAWSKEEQ